MSDSESSSIHKTKRRRSNSSTSRSSRSVSSHSSRSSSPSSSSVSSHHHRKHRHSSSKRSHSRHHRSKHRHRSERRKKEKRHKRSRSSSSSRSVSSSSRHRSRRHHHKKRSSKKHAGSLPKGVVRPGQYKYGSHGIINEGDMFDKKEEFRTWMWEIKNQDMSGIPNWKQKELFREFCEDFNTSTLPHEKYYDLGKWEREEAEKGASNQPVVDSGGLNEHTIYFDEEKKRLEKKMEKNRQSRIEAMQERAALLYEQQAKESAAMERLLQSGRR
ncbi:hypothetical protein BLNAU_6470 [Blattamonas nauphoetae]|uniref:Uncharacterized protein n=1 Tax=Blattamonas nauphoetae TaxID=2049346 RepID=A0ABQ9Y3W1_9EUKA|nr:hypothetical protein BLNAU_6470 [Blattamonas nauphoetae]